MEEVAPRVVAWELGRAICWACKSKLKDLPVHVSSTRCVVLNSRCWRLWCVFAPKCICVVFFFRCKHCAYDGCVDRNYGGTLCMVDSVLSFIYK